MGSPGSVSGTRAGTYALSLLSDPLDVQLLHAVAEGRLSLKDLCREVGVPRQTTIRGRLQILTDLDILQTRPLDGSLGSTDYEITRAGRDLLAVAQVIEAWFAEAPNGPPVLGTTAAKRCLKSLSDAWSLCIIRALAAHPLSLTELSKLISALNYPSLERRLVAARAAGLVEARQGSRKGTPYAPTKWLRQAIGPLIAAVRWEQRHIPLIAPPPNRIDIETTFLLALPLLRLCADLSGTCRLAVEVTGSTGDHNLAGVLVGVESGRIARCVSRLRGEAGSWASGSAPAWLDATLDQEPGRLEIGGDVGLATALLDGLHGVLSGTKAGV